MRRKITKDLFKAMLCDYHDGLNVTELSEKYNFQVQTIRKHFIANNIELTSNNGKVFSKDEIKNIIDDYKSGMKVSELAIKYNRNSGTIIGKLKSIGEHNPIYHQYSEEESKILKELYICGDWDAINKKFPNIDKNQIYSKMSKLGIKMESYFWTIEEENILIDNYENMLGKIKDFKILFNNKFTYGAIVSKAEKMGLKTRDYWSQEEIDLLKNNYEICDLNEMMNILSKRSRRCIINKANSIGLKNKITLENCFSPDDMIFIKNNMNKMTDAQIGLKLNRTARSITDVRLRNAWIKQYEKSSYNDLSEYVRRNNVEWKKKSMKHCKYKCVLSGERFDDIHHIYGLNNILMETMNALNIKIKNTMDEYSDKELKNILELFREIQYGYPLGVCLSKDIHMLFHKIYGYGNNTEEQWDEFILNYKNSFIDVA